MNTNTKEQEMSRRKKFVNLLKKECYLCFAKEDLTFHHLKNKLGNISDLTNHMGFKMLVKEIKKCLVLCRSCHYKLHYGEIEFIKDDADMLREHWKDIHEQPIEKEERELFVWPIFQ